MAVGIERTKFKSLEEREIVMNGWHPEPFPEPMGVTVRLNHQLDGHRYKGYSQDEAELQEPAWYH